MFSEDFLEIINKTEKAYNAKIWLFPKIDMSNIPWILLYCKSAEEIKQKLIKNDSNLGSVRKKGCFLF